MSTGAYYGWITFLLIFIAALLYLLIWALLNRGKYQTKQQEQIPLRIKNPKRARNMVIAGKYAGATVSKCKLFVNDGHIIPLNADTVQDVNTHSCEVIDTFGWVKKRIAAGAFFGNIGVLMLHRNYKTKYLVKLGIVFKDGGRSLLELDLDQCNYIKDALLLSYYEQQ